MDVSTGAAVAAFDDNAVGAVIPPSSTNNKDAYVACKLGVLRLVPVKPPQPPRCCHRAATVMLAATAALRAAATTADAAAAAAPPPSFHQRCAGAFRHRQPRAVVLPPLPLTLPLLSRRHQAAANVALSCYRHRCSLHAAATVLPPSRCAQPPCFVLPPPPLTLPPIEVVVNIKKYQIKLSLTNNVVAVTVGVGVGSVVVGGVVGGGVIVGSGGALGTALDVSTGGAVAANDDDAFGAVLPPSSTNDKDAYNSALAALEGMCISAFTDGASESTTASALLPPRCRHCAVRRRRASRCRHHR